LLKLEEKILNKSAIIGIVGLGYVGLPLAVAFAEAGFKVLGFDVQQSRTDQVNKGNSYIADIESKRLKPLINKKRLVATTDQSKINNVDAVCICVPTPINKTKDPDLSYVITEAEEVSRYMKKGQLIILESTTYPGTTREVVLPILERSGLKAGKSYYMAFSPERVDPGNYNFTVKNTPKVVGGINPVSTRMASLLYSQISDKTIPVSSPEAAEMTKVFENVFRNINIALVNELAHLCHHMGISVWEVIEAAATKPFGYMQFKPGPGVGGHCIPIDPYYLSHKAREYDFHMRFIELAAEINENMPYYATSCIAEALNTYGKSLKNAKIILLGVTYKKDVADLRESPSLKLLELLHQKGADIKYNDPYIPKIQLPSKKLSSITLNKTSISAADCIVIATNHSCYDLKSIIKMSKLVYDTRGVTRKFKNNHIIRLGE